MLVTGASNCFVDLLVAIVFVSENIVDVENIVAIFIVIAVILDSFARLCKNPSRVPRRFILEGRVTYSVGGR